MRPMGLKYLRQCSILYSIFVTFLILNTGKSDAYRVNKKSYVVLFLIHSYTNHSNTSVILSSKKVAVRKMFRIWRPCVDNKTRLLLYFILDQSELRTIFNQSDDSTPFKGWLTWSCIFSCKVRNFLECFTRF